MPRYKIWILLLFIVFSLGVVAWLARIQFSEFIISSAMLDSGLTNVTTDISQLDLDQSHIPYIGFSLMSETGHLQFEMYNTFIKYQPGQLIKSRVDSVTIDKIALRSERTKTTQDDAPTVQVAFDPRKTIEQLRHALREYVIFKTLMIKSITLDGEPYGMLDGKNLQLNSTGDNETLYIELTFLEPSSAGITAGLSQLVVTSLSGENIIAELKFSETPGITPARLKLNFQEAAISGDYSISPQHLQHWMLSVVDLKGVDGGGIIKGTFSFNFETDKQIDSTITLLADKITYGENSADNIDLKLKINNSTDNLLQHTQIQNGTYISAGNINLDNISLADARIKITGDLTNSADSWQYQADFISNLFSVNYDSKLFKIKDITAHAAGNNQNIKVDGTVATAVLNGRFAFELDHSFTEQFGQFSIGLLAPINLTKESKGISQLLTPWPYPFDLLSGTINLSSQAAWSQNHDFSLGAKVNFDDVGGHLGELIFSRLSFNHELEVLPRVLSNSKSNISLKHIDSGVAISDLNADLTLEASSAGSQPRFVVQGFKAEIFDGTFSGDNLVFDMNKRKNNFKIEAKNIDLAKIVETQQLEGLTATGKINGVIPVEINDQGVMIEDGFFLSDAQAGTIRYNPAAGTDQLKQNPLTGIALDALKDFRYSELSAGVDFTPEGKLTIDLKLKGTSPELETARPVHLNISTEQNLISLLKSLRFAEGISEDIDNKVRRQYEKSKNNN